MNESKDIVLVADYHAENIEQRRFNEATGEERTLKYPTARAGILRQVEQAAQELSPGGRVVWIMESTTGWARVKDLVAYAGLVPGTWQSDGTCHHGRIGGSGTDAHLRYLVIEASTWLCQIPRYRPAYERIVARRGNKIGRIVVARLFLRSLYKMLRDGVRFHPGVRAPSAPTEAEPTSNGAFIALEPTASGKGKRPSTEEGRLAVGAAAALGSLASGALSSATATTG